MKKILHKRLSSYSRLAAAAAAVTPLASTAGIVYTDVDPDETLGVNEFFEIDFNNDGVIDMVVGITTATGTYGGDPLYFQGAFASGNGAGSFAGSVQYFGGSPFYFPEAYNAGAAIDETLTWQPPGGFGSMNYVTSIGAVPLYTGGNWLNQSDKYLAVRFILGSEFHYGWVRMDVGAPGTSNSVVVKGFAFEAVADEGIEAGLEEGGVVPSGLSAPDFSERFNCFSFGNTVYLQSLDAEHQGGNVEIFDMAGKQVYAGIMTDVNTQIQLADARGMYVVRIRQSDALMSRKIYLNSER